MVKLMYIMINIVYSICSFPTQAELVLGQRTFYKQKHDQLLPCTPVFV